MTKHVIRGQYTGCDAEDVDEYEDRPEAFRMLGEYRESFGTGWRLWIVRRKPAKIAPTDNPACYRIVRLWRDSSTRRTIKRGLTLEQAQAHCKDPETSSSTCKGAAGRRRTQRGGPWFDSYTD